MPHADVSAGQPSLPPDSQVATSTSLQSLSEARIARPVCSAIGLPPEHVVEKFIDGVLSYYQARSWNADPIIPSLRSLMRTARCQELFAALKDACEFQQTLGNQLGGVLAAYSTLVNAALQTERLSQCLKGGHIVVFSAARNHLLRGSMPQAQPSGREEEQFMAHMRTQELRDFADEFISLIERGARPSDLRLFYELTKSLEALGKDRREVPLSFMFLDVLSASFSTQQQQLFFDAVLSAARRGTDLITVGKAFCELVQDSFPPERRAERASIWEATSERIRAAINANNLEVEDLRDLTALLEHGPDAEIVELYTAIMSRLPAGEARTNYNRSSLIGRLAALTTDRPHPQPLRNFLSALNKGEITSVSQLLRRLFELNCHGYVATVLRSDSVTEQGRAWQNLFDVSVSLAKSPGDEERHLSFLNSRRIFSTYQPSEHNYFALNLHKRIRDIFHGFGALEFEARRRPDGEPSLSARYGDAIGRVEMLIAEDNDRFPGRGTRFSEIRLKRIFAADQQAAAQAGDPWRHYKEAWPGYAAEFTDVDSTTCSEIRGMIVLSCSVPEKYSILTLGGKRVPVSLLLYNDHTHNRRSVLAFLAATELIEPLLDQCAVPFEDFRGHIPQRADIASLPLTPQELVRRGATHALGVIDIGAPWRITQGFAYESALADPAFRAAKAKHDEIVAEWNSRGSIHYSSEGYHLADKFEQQRSLMDQLMQRFNFPGHQPFGAAVTIAGQYLNLYDIIMRLGRAAFHKGQSAGGALGFGERVQLEPVLDGGDGALFNPHAALMLRELYAWHSQRYQGVRDRKRFPVGVIADPLNYSDVPDTPLIIDSFNMKMTLGSAVIQLPQESDGSGVEENLIWSERILPHFAFDSRRDLRLCNRAIFGLV